MNTCRSPIELGSALPGLTVTQALRGKENPAVASPGITKDNGGLGLSGRVQ